MSMVKIKRRAALGAGSLAAGVLLFAGLPAEAQASPVRKEFISAATSSAAVAARVAARSNFACGYDGYDGSNGDQPLYNHCGAKDIVIEVDHFFWQTTYDCVAPGVHEINQGDSRWRIIGAEYDGHACSSPGSVVGP